MDISRYDIHHPLQYASTEWCPVLSQSIIAANRLTRLIFMVYTRRKRKNMQIRHYPKPWGDRSQGSYLLLARWAVELSL